jgi:putative DNA primase/helicase
MGNQPNGMTLIAIDVDGAVDLLDPLVAKWGALPDTLTARTGSGGMHLVFRWPAGVKLPGNWVKSHAPNVDIRAERGQIVVAPSMHYSGNRYAWTRAIEPAELPAAWVEGLGKKPSKTLAAVPTVPREATSLNSRARAYVAKMEPAVSGQGGHAATWAVARKLVADFQLDEQAAMAIMREYNQRCVPPWSEAELLHKVQSAGAAIVRNPIEDRPREAQAEQVYEPEVLEKPKHSVEPTAGVHHFLRGDHVEIGEALLSDLRSYARTLYTLGAFYNYRSELGTFNEIEREKLSRIVQSYAGSTKGVDASLRLGVHDIKGSLSLAADTAHERDFFASARDGIAFADGFIEVTASEIIRRPHSPENRARFAYPFAYQSAACPERLLRFFGECFTGDADAAQKIALIQEHMGLSLIGQGTRYQKAVMFFGKKGQEGKSTSMAIVKSAMPPGSVISIPPHGLGNEYKRATFSRARLNLVSEVQEREITEPEPWKAIIDGKNEIDARSPYKDVIFFKPVAGHLYSCNRLPGTTDQSGGFWRRWAVVEFNHRFDESKQDADLDKKIIEAEQAEIVSWMLQGAQRALARGHYDLPESSIAAVAAWRRQADQVAAFVDEACTVVIGTNLDAWEGAQMLYNAYTRWAISAGHRNPLSQVKFSDRLELLKHEKRSRSSGNVYPLKLKPGF